MPEEAGVEPNELFEQTERGHHIATHESSHSTEDSDAKRFSMRSAITAAILAAAAAIASLLSGHAANEAILKTVEASDQWSYYQAKSTRAAIYSSQHESKEAAKYEIDKAQIQKEAQSMQNAGQDEFARHQKFSFAVAAFQIGIVLSSLAIMTRSSWLYYESLFAGLFGIVFCVIGALPN